MINVGKLNATTTEQSISIGGNADATLILTADNDVEISINDNTHYQTYKYGEVIPLTNRYDGFKKLFYKTLSGTAQVRYWIS